MSSNLVVTFTNPPTNYVGSIVFRSYIVAALWLTISISWDLGQSYFGNAQTSTRGPAVRSTYYRAAITLLSFGILSHNMLFFLINSYMSWTATSGRPRPSSENHFEVHLTDWMLESSLFDQFGHALIDDGRGWPLVWTTLALTWTYAVNVWMSLAGREKGVTGRWRYFMLAQILPITFTYNLFNLAVEIQSQTSIDQSKGAIDQSEATEDQSKKAAHQRTSQQDNRLWTFDTLTNSEALQLVVLAAGAMAIVYILPGQAESSVFVPLILAVRLLLFLPFIVTGGREINRPKDSRTPPDRPILSQMNVRMLVGALLAITGIVLGTALNKLPGESRNIHAAWRGLNQNWAVRALGYDFLIGIVSWAFGF